MHGADPGRRRALLALAGLGLLAGGRILPWGCTSGPGPSGSSLQRAPLRPAQADGLRLLPGFSARVVARSGQPPLAGGGFVWPGAPDGGAAFATGDGGWVYVANSEIPAGRGGASALRFGPTGELIDAYPVLSGTSVNCAGGATAWGTWLSCEENGDAGRVFECDPLGVHAAVERPALGYFSHEAVAVDAARGQLYLTEDRHDGRLYRFTPDRYPDLSAGRLEVAQVLDPGRPGTAERDVVWLPVPDPAGVGVPTRAQVPRSTPFRRGEGIACRGAMVYFATTADNRVWAYDASRARLSVLYAAGTFTGELRGVDNVAIAPDGEVLVAEDGDDMQIVALTPDGDSFPVVQVVGHRFSEMTGPSFADGGRRLYFSSQRGPDYDPRVAGANPFAGGITYEVSLPAPD